MTPPSTMAQRFFAGGLAGAISRTVVAPLERLRTMVRAQHNFDDDFACTLTQGFRAQASEHVHPTLVMQLSLAIVLLTVR